MNRRLGKFTVSDELVHSDSFSQVLANMTFIPTRVELRYDLSGFEYIGLSHLFREVPLGEMVPEYRISVTEIGRESSVSVEEI